jgi:glycosyltransferase involved in cell wall biosynthesis
VELLIVGDPGSQGYLRALRRMAGESGAGDRIRFLGHSEDVFAILRQSDAALMCSRCEAFGRVTVEGMLAGKPVIGARSGGTPEIVRDETDGLLYEPCNPPDLARKIRFLCEHPEAAARMGASGRERYGDRMAAILQSPGR